MSGNCPATGEKDLGRIVLGIRDLFFGRSDASGQFTCTINVASTTVTARNCGAKSRVLLTPASAQAATELASGNCYVSSVAVGQFVIAHSNNANGSRTFNYAING